MLAEAAERAQVEIWFYCLMPNHVHIIAVPSDADGLWRTFRRAHRDYTGYINARMRVTDPPHPPPPPITVTVAITPKLSP